MRASIRFAGGSVFTDVSVVGACQNALSVVRSMSNLTLWTSSTSSSISNNLKVLSRLASLGFGITESVILRFGKLLGVNAGDSSATLSLILVLVDHLDEFTSWCLERFLRSSISNSRVIALDDSVLVGKVNNLG